uniref:Uncharacterized protein n=1 Tax=Tanacetum cinerariifolium TaxID=118510 RepID=A0A6L2M2J6_TANCI|nr:hypothetical protein [Tanacetum cinerariifolium]
MSAKHTSWNEFCSAMASAIICLSNGENVEEGIAVEQVQNDDAAQEGVTAAIENDVQEQSIPSPTSLPQPPQDFSSTSSVQPTPPPSPQPQPQAADFPLDKLDMDEGVALTTKKEEEKKTKKAKNSAGDDQKKQQVKIDEEYARKLHEELNQVIDWDVATDHVKQKAKEDPYVQRLDYFKKQIDEEERRATESINKTPAQKASKRRKLNKEVAELNKHLEIVPDEDNDVFTEATPLARKVPVVDYSIIFLNNKPHYKIVKADGTH